jgi:hypothetical protein
MWKILFLLVSLVLAGGQNDAIIKRCREEVIRKDIDRYTNHKISTFLRKDLRIGTHRKMIEGKIGNPDCRVYGNKMWIYLRNEYRVLVIEFDVVADTVKNISY